jgi:probable non-F420 flavinoid oxidoreductase
VRTSGRPRLTNAQTVFPEESGRCPQPSVIDSTILRPRPPGSPTDGESGGRTKVGSLSQTSIVIAVSSQRTVTRTSPLVYRNALVTNSLRARSTSSTRRPLTRSATNLRATAAARGSRVSVSDPVRLPSTTVRLPCFAVDQPTVESWFSQRFETAVPGYATPMATIGFHASHEQVHPRHLLDAVQAAEKAGFAAAMSSDHFSPWSERQGHSGFAWSWLGAALATTALPFGVVNAPGQRYHPAVIAQASATLASMFPGRFWMALGTGEAANEHITGQPWPTKPQRAARLLECVEVIRALHRGEEVTHRGLVTVDRARVWTLPDEPVKLVAAAVSAETAKWAAGWADGLITVSQPVGRLRNVIAAYRDNGGRGPARVQMHVSYAADEETAMAVAHDQWRTNVFDAPVCWDLETPEEFDRRARRVTVDEVCAVVRVSSDPGRHAGWIHEVLELGFDEIFLHHVGQTQREFIEVFGAEVLPEFAAST